ncbi:YVTN family beta-propeller protein [Pseudomonas sp. GGS8]|uniref:YncE family protein n=1 Tax=Pseudomonas sp. GGS8 TaxID=2817892 RepID=UPI00209F025A|nr:beta-propeller fold lactonase family protein [Pseudomonas sp. GGS8]MCP1442925.1 YVTN family beta-propeller protein [Pseudomonas sp. GGS8]
MSHNSGSSPVITPNQSNSIAVGEGPRGIAISADGSRVFVCNYISGTVSVIDTRNKKVIRTIAVEQYPRNIALGHEGKRAYVTNYGSSSVSVIDTDTYAVGNIMVGRHPSGVVVSRDGKHVYVTVRQNKEWLAIIDTRLYAVSRVQGLPSPSISVDISPDDSRLYISSTNPPAGAYEDALTVISSKTFEIVNIIKTEQYPSTVTVSPDGRKVYIVCLDARKLTVLDTESSSTRHFDFVTCEGKIVFGEKNAYAVDQTSKEVVEINTNTYEIVGRVPIPRAVEPYDMVLDQHNRAYISDYQGDEVHIVDLT